MGNGVVEASSGCAEVEIGLVAAEATDLEVDLATDLEDGSATDLVDDSDYDPSSTFSLSLEKVTKLLFSAEIPLFAQSKMIRFEKKIAVLY